MDKIAIIGGSYNPPHVAHVLAANYTALTSDFDQVRIIPTYVHSSKTNLIDFNHRLKMCELAFGYIPNLIINPIERYLPTPSLTINTLKALHDQQKADYRFVIGSDILFNLNLWEDIETVFKLAPPFILGRIGYESPEIKSDISLPNISSTHIRELLKSSKYNEELTKVVPNSVLKYKRK